MGIDIKKYYFEHVKPEDYHYTFWDTINKVNTIYNIFRGEEEVNNFQFEVYDTEEAIAKFRELCQPEIYFDKEKTVWFYLLTFFLFSMGYEIKTFPRLLARPPKDPTEFTYKAIRTRIIENGEDDNGTVKYDTRRVFVANLQFEIKQTYIGIGNNIEQKFIEISNRNASFDDMSPEEKLAEIANLIENMLKRNGKFLTLDYSSICFDYVTNDMIASYRKKLHCFRHSSSETIAERKAYTDEQKAFFVDYGLTVIKVIYALSNFEQEQSQ